MWILKTSYDIWILVKMVEGKIVISKFMIPISIHFTTQHNDKFFDIFACQDINCAVPFLLMVRNFVAIRHLVGGKRS